MNPNLDKLHPYPFEKLRRLFRGIQPPSGLREIRLSIGEPQHETPAFIKEALSANLQGLANYPTTSGSDALRGAIPGWLTRRYGIPEFYDDVVSAGETGYAKPNPKIFEAALERMKAKPEESPVNTG